MKHIRKILGLVLCLAMVLQMLPASAFLVEDCESIGQSHKWSDWYYVQEPTCTEPGTRNHWCEVCGYTPQAEPVGPLGHAWGEWEMIDEPTCEGEGCRQRQCTRPRCGAYDVQELPPTGHVWGEWHIDTPATCEHPGEKSRMCQKCRMREEAAIPAGNHDWTEWKTDPSVHASCVQKEMQYHSCRACGATEFRAAGYGGHDWGEWEVVVPATATEPGVERRVCKNDPSHVEEREIPATGEPAGELPAGTVPGNVPGNAPEDTEPKGALHLELQLSPENAQTVFGPGDLVLVDYVLTNTGDVPVSYIQFYTGTVEARAGLYAGTVQPGETIVTGIGFYLTGMADPTQYVFSAKAVGVTDSANARLIDYFGQACGNGTAVISNEASLVIPIVVEEDELKAELTLVDLGDIPTQDVYDIDGYVHSYFRVFNTGERPLLVQKYTQRGNGTEGSYFLSDKPLQPGDWDGGGSGVGRGTIPERITPGTETEELLGTVDMTYWFIGYDPETMEQLCTTNAMTRSWKVRKPGPSEWEIPEESWLEAAQRELSTPANPNGYQLGETWTLETEISNVGTVPADFTISLDDVRNMRNHVNGFPLEPGMQTQYWSNGTVTEEDVERGYIYFVPAEITWTDPDSEMEHTIWSNDVVLPVIKAGGPQLLVQKSLANQPANGQYYTTGETIEWSLVITNTGTETMTNVHVWDEETGYTEIDVEDLAPGQSVSVNLPSNYVDGNIVMTLDTYANMAVVTATDEKGGQRQYAGFAYAPLNADGAKKHPVNGGDDDGKNGTEGDPEYVPGLPETPDHPGTPGGGEDPLGPVYEKNAHLTIYKTVSSTPVNGEFYEVGETIQYVITVTNDGETELADIIITDELAGMIWKLAVLAPGVKEDLTAEYTVTEDDLSHGSVLNCAVGSYTFDGDPDTTVSGTPILSDPVTVPTDEDGGLPGGEDGEAPGEPGPGTPGGGWFDPDKLPGGDKPVTYPDGTPVTHPDGTPITAPEGTKPVTDPDGTPVTVPTDTPVTGPDGTPIPGPDGTPIIIPAGTPVLELPDGTCVIILPGGIIIVVDPDGTPILDSDGGMVLLDSLPGAADFCAVRLDSMGSAEVTYTLHVCKDHVETAKAAEAAAAAGTAEGWKQAADLWREELNEMYQALIDAGDSAAKTAVAYDRAVFDTYLANYEMMNRAADEVTVQKIIAEQLRLRCAELCCAIHTAPDRMPGSLLNGYARANDTNGIPGREIEAMNNGDAILRERYTAAGARTLEAVKGTLEGAKTSMARANAFVQAQAAWQVSLDRVVNAGYKAADKEGRKAIAASRKTLDQVCAAHRDVLEMLYASAPEVTEEAIASIYRNALLDAVMVFGIQ